MVAGYSLRLAVDRTLFLNWWYRNVPRDDFQFDIFYHISYYNKLKSKAKFLLNKLHTGRHCQFKYIIQPQPSVMQASASLVIIKLFFLSENIPSFAKMQIRFVFLKYRRATPYGSEKNIFSSLFIWRSAADFPPPSCFDVLFFAWVSAFCCLCSPPGAASSSS